MKLAVHLRRRPNSPWVAAFCPDLPGCAATGRSEEEALANLRRRIAEQTTQCVEAARQVHPGTRVTIIDV